MAALADTRQSPFVAHAPGFADVVGDAPRLAKVVDTDAHEGPVYAAGEDALYFTTLPRLDGLGAPERPRVSIKRISLDGDRFPLEPEHVTVFRADANVANGMALDTDGRLLVCEQGTFTEPAGITRLEPATRTIEPVVDAYRGLALNSPNDVVVASDGAIWFTDPSYGSLQGFRPAPAASDAVYRFDRASGELDLVADSLDKPNGLAFSPDGAILYIGDSGAIHEPGNFDARRPHQVLAYDVVGGRRLDGERVFAVVSPGFPDGIKADAGGRVYVSSLSGVQVFAPDGERLGEIVLPGAVNFCFGGPRRNVLFITTDTAVWAAVLHAKGA